MLSAFRTTGGATGCASTPECCGDGSSPECCGEAVGEPCAPNATGANKVRRKAAHNPILCSGL